MTTTDHIQIKNNFYTSRSESLSSKYIKTQTNNRYKNFNQCCFTAGDEEQFRRYSVPTNTLNIDQPILDRETNLHIDRVRDMDIFDKFSDLPPSATIDTFRYMSNKFKKGIFVKIKNNKLVVFLPFSKHMYTNEWSDNISSSYKDVYLNKTKYVNSNMDEWYANNYLVRNEYPVCENDTNTSILKNMLEELCLNRKVEDIELFINKRDFPLMSKHGFEPYGNVWGDDKVKLVSHAYDKYTPICSMSVTDQYADVLLPNYNDWSLIQQQNNIWFSDDVTEYNIDQMNRSWDTKKKIAVFRGSNTGEGITTETNPRLKAAYLSSQLQQSNGSILDAGITKWNTRPRKLKHCSELRRVDVDSLGFGLSTPLSPVEQSNYKYVLYIQGHVSAHRLSVELAMQSVILMVESDWYNWYMSSLIPYVHYVPVKRDMSDLLEKIHWCIDNDDLCKVIAENSYQFYLTYLNKDSVLDYMQCVLGKLHTRVNNATGFERVNIPRSLTVHKQETLIHLSKYIPCVNIKPSIPLSNTIRKFVSEFTRDIGMFEGLKHFINHTSVSPYTSTKYLSTRDNVQLNTVNIKGLECISKSTNCSESLHDLVHESFIGINCINPICHLTPNLSYTFSLSVKNATTELFKEKVMGITLHDFYKSDRFSIHDFSNITRQIFYTLHIARNTTGFCHNDLTPWNVMVRMFEIPVKINYEIDGESVEVVSKFVPVLIDYGKSRSVYNNVIYTNIPDDYDVNTTTRDIVSFIMTTVKCMLQQNLTHRELSLCINLVNYCSGTEYIPKSVHTLKDLRRVVKNKSKFSSIMYDATKGLETKTPLDFIKYIDKMYPSTPPTIYKQFELVKGYGSVIFSYLMSSEDDEFRRICEDSSRYIMGIVSRIQGEHTWVNYYILHRCRSILLYLRSDLKTVDALMLDFEECLDKPKDMGIYTSNKYRDEDLLEPGIVFDDYDSSILEETKMYEQVFPRMSGLTNPCYIQNTMKLIRKKSLIY